MLGIYFCKISQIQQQQWSKKVYQVVKLVTCENFYLQLTYRKMLEKFKTINFAKKMNYFIKSMNTLHCGVSKGFMKTLKAFRNIGQL